MLKLGIRGLSPGIIAALMVFLLFGCSSPEKAPSPILFNTFISGSIARYEANSLDSTVILMERNIITDDAEQHVAIINAEEGTFSFNFELEEAKSMILRYGNKNYYLYAGPKDSLVVRIKPDTTHPQKGQVSVTGGKQQTMNKYINEYLALSEEIMRNNPLPREEETDFATYLMFVDSLMITEKKAFKTFLEKNNIEDPLFIQWATDKINLNRPNLLFMYEIKAKMRARAMSKKQEVEIVTPDLEMATRFRILEDSLDIQSPHLIQHSYFHYFYNVYQAHVTYKVAELCRQKDPECPSAKFTDTFLTHLDENYSGQTHNLLLSRFIYGKIRQLQIQKKEEFIGPLEGLLAQVDDKLPTENRDFLLKSFERTKAMVLGSGQNTVYNDYSGKLGGEILDQILEKQKGNVVYVKFWAPWCGPCLANWDGIAALNKHFSGEDFRIMTVCINTDKEKWAGSIKKLGGPAEHVYLSNDQSNLIMTGLQIDAIPHNILIDKIGTVRNTDAPETGSPHMINKLLLEQIEYLLLE
ncbi:MAG: TlpA family protein disulfide reductase [Cyclobacteriaceae bacterium]|nr:TlpA family protein disulfide reductase [Cyclobacteriaceae bacterium]